MLSYGLFLKRCKLNFEVCLGELACHGNNSNIFVNFSYPFVLLVRYCLLLVLVYLELHKPFLLATSRIATLLWCCCFGSNVHTTEQGIYFLVEKPLSIVL